MIDPGNSQKEKEVDEVAPSEQQEPPLEQQEPQNLQAQETESKVELTATEEGKAATDGAEPENPSVRGKKRAKKAPEVMEAELMPRPSIWPILLALSVAILLGGFAFNLIILGVGVVLVIVSTLGWNLERR